MPADYISRNRITIVINRTENKADGIRIQPVLEVSEFIKVLEKDKFFAPILDKIRKLQVLIDKKGEEVELGSSKFSAYVLKTDGRLYHRMIGSKWDSKKNAEDRL